jgi:hypothetical protein
LHTISVWAFSFFSDSERFLDRHAFDEHFGIHVGENALQQLKSHFVCFVSLFSFCCFFGRQQIDKQESENPLQQAQGKAHDCSSVRSFGRFFKQHDSVKHRGQLKAVQPSQQSVHSAGFSSSFSVFV